MKKIKSALISVSDKSNLKPLLKILKKNKINLISSGGTFKTIKKLKFKCTEVADYTGFKEILGGRVKTDLRAELFTHAVIENGGINAASEAIKHNIHMGQGVMNFVHIPLHHNVR